MNLLLIGHTGFLGKNIIYQLLKNTNHNLYISIRSKNNTSFQQRFNQILQEFDIYDDFKDDKRIKLIQTNYDENRNLIIDTKDKNTLINNVEVIINCLSDIKFNRPIKKATLNNTVTALKWLEFFKTFKNKNKYIYVSSAFVNYHRINYGEIPETIQEHNMSQDNLNNILNNKQTNIGTFENTYLYTKQLTEVLLDKNKDEISLSILRPSIIIPALETPYPGWGSIQSASIAIIASSLGLFCFFPLKNFNTIPVDIAADDCISLIETNNRQTDVIHSCFTNNINNWISNKFHNELSQEIYKVFNNNPTKINYNIYTPFQINFDYNIFSIIYTILKFIIFKYSNSTSFKDFLFSLYNSFLFNYYYFITYYKFTRKSITFKRNKTNIFNNNVDCKKCLIDFSNNIDNIIKNNKSDFDKIFLKYI